jgi:DNA-binding NtrC family response regulator
MFGEKFNMVLKSWAKRPNIYTGDFAPEIGMKRILIVDDDVSTCQQLEQALQTLGYEAITAHDGEEALEVFDREDIDLVIADIIMPKLSGTELLKKIHERDKDIRVIMITGIPSRESILDTIEHEGFTYLTKPIQVETMKYLIDRALESSGSLGTAEAGSEEK